MKITFLKAGNGDCIHIMDAGHNIIIDSGESCQELVTLVDKIQSAGEKIDLLVITHYDADHIKEINNILDGMKVEDRKDLVKKVWFNASKVGYHGNETLLSAADATQLATLLLNAEINWISELKVGVIEQINDSLSVEVLEGGELYRPDEEGSLLGNEKSDWNTSFKELERFLDDDVVDESVTNAQSIIVVVHYNGKSVLLPGDAVPAKLSAALEIYGKGKTVKFDLVKLPHHGSYKNITHEILDKIECSDYVISTDGKKYCHPDKKMMIKVIKWGKRIEGMPLTFHLNYYDELYNLLCITEDEKRHYSFDCDGKRAFEF